jgi:hypothetical protein
MPRSSPVTDSFDRGFALPAGKVLTDPQKEEKEGRKGERRKKEGNTQRRYMGYDYSTLSHDAGAF